MLKIDLETHRITFLMHVKFFSMNNLDKQPFKNVMTMILAQNLVRTQVRLCSPRPACYA